MKNLLFFLLLLLSNYAAIAQSTETQIIEKYVHPCVLDALFKNSAELLRVECTSTSDLSISKEDMGSTLKRYVILSNASHIYLNEDTGNLFSFYIVFRNEKDFSEFTNAWIKEFDLKAEGDSFYKHASWLMFTLNLAPRVENAPPNMAEIWVRYP